MNAPKHAPKHAPSPRDLAKLAASDPMPSTAERGPVARMHWRSGLETDVDLERVVLDRDTAPVEWSALLAETHAALLDPDGMRPLSSPSPIGSAVVDTLRASEHWPVLADAARAHPVVARDAIKGLADVVLDALKSAGARPETDARKALADLDAARARLLKAREAERDAKTPTEQRDALKEKTEALAAEERAKGSHNAAHGIAQRTETALEGDAAGAALARVAAQVSERADAVRTFDAAIGDAAGLGGVRPVSAEIVKLLTGKLSAMLKRVGALRPTIRQGRASRHVAGREGMIGTSTAGIERVGDATVVALAALAGGLGAESAALARLDLVESRLPVVEKGGGNARQGAVVVVVDQSGSMQGAREEWAGALALATILEARRENRPAALVTYSGKVRASVVVDTPARLVEAMRALSASAGGNTHTPAALAEATAVLGRMPQGQTADVLLVTDGEWDADDVAHAKGLERARLRGVFIGGAAPTTANGGSVFASTWSLESTDDDSAVRLAVDVARTMV